MKNKIGDLRDHMFAALERLSDENLTEEQLKQEIQRAQAASEVGKIIVESAKTEILYAKVTGNQLPKKYIEEDEPSKPALIRPPAEYGNKQHVA